MDATTAIINILAGFDPTGTVPRSLTTHVYVLTAVPPEGVRIDKGNWTSIGATERSEAKEPGVDHAVPKAPLVVIDVGWTDKGVSQTDLVVCAPARALDALAKLALKKINGCDDDTLIQLRPAHDSLIPLVRDRRLRILAERKKAQDKADAKAMQKALIAARKVCGNEHTARANAHLFM